MWHQGSKIRSIRTQGRLPAVCLALMVAVVLVGNAAPAQASGIGTPTNLNINASLPAVPCTDQLRHLPWDHVYFDLVNDEWVYEYFGFSLMSKQETFDASDVRSVANDKDFPVSATFTSQKSATWTIKVNAIAQLKFTDFLSANVTTEFSYSKTTQVGVSVTAMVPAHAIVTARYGLVAYNITTMDEVVQVRRRNEVLPNGVDNARCWRGLSPVNRNIPTIDERWRVS
jgi:hypothetical protein